MKSLNNNFLKEVETKDNPNNKETAKLKPDLGNDSDDPTEKMFDKKPGKFSDSSSEDFDLKADKPLKKKKADSDDLDEELKDRVNEEDIGFDKNEDRSSSEDQKKGKRYLLHFKFI